MNRRDFLKSSLALFALTALPKLTLAETVAVSEEVRKKSIRKINWGSVLCVCR